MSISFNDTNWKWIANNELNESIHKWKFESFNYYVLFIKLYFFY